MNPANLLPLVLLSFGALLHAAAAPDVPEAPPRTRPVEDINDAIVYTINESIQSDAALALARRVPSDVLIRAWFKWHDAPDWAKSAHLVPQAHAFGALFGGGITCSALYDGENGLSNAQVRDLATRGPDGQLVDAWATKGCRHGSLSNPAYLDYLLSWCRKQIDAGADYLFMDEINAALQANEGFDDYSLRDYRTWLKGHGLDAQALAPPNPRAAEWHAFRRERDDRAWKHLCDAIRAYAAAKGRRVLLSANGLAPYVDLQVLGVWGLWRVKDGAIDLAESQLDEWAATVASGRALARRPVPVVFFHDWGFGGFPWLEVPPADRRLWTRVRGAEIYAAGAFFAFPVHGPFGQDASRDGTLDEVVRQAAFYQQHKGLYLDARLLGFEPLATKEPLLSLALWRREKPPALLLHVVNRQAEAGLPKPRRNVAVRIPGAPQPKSVRIVSPDWSGEKQGSATADGQGATIVLPELEAYAVAILDYDALPELKLFGSRIVPTAQWARPEESEFVVQKDGSISNAWALNAYLQGNLHPDLRNPPTFVVHMPKGGAIRVHVRAVATLGATIQCVVDGCVAGTVDLPDRDKKNDGSAREYGETFDFPIPPGRHRVTVQNTGGDWATVAWYTFAGELAE